MTAEHLSQSRDLIQSHIFNDLVVFLGIFVAIFGSLFGLGLWQDQPRAISYESRFTDSASTRAGDNLTRSLGSLFTSLTFELGWSNKGVGLADAWTEYFGKPEEQIFGDSTFTSIAQAVLEPDTRVLGTTDDVSQKAPTSQVSPWMGVTSLATNEEIKSLNSSSNTIRATTKQYKTLPVNPLPTVSTGYLGNGFYEIISAEKKPLSFIEFKPSFEDIKAVEFYVEGNLVTTDTHTPYFLGSDEAGTPNGYDLKRSDVGIRISASVIGLDGVSLETHELILE